jgi:hypothetical protein
MPNFRALPGVIQSLIAIVVIGICVVLAGVAGLSGGWAIAAGTFAGSLALSLWEAFGSKT